MGDIDLDFERKDISLVTGFTVLKLGLLLLKDIESVSAKLSPELNLLTACIENERHPVYGAMLAMQ